VDHTPSPFVAVKVPVPLSKITATQFASGSIENNSILFGAIGKSVLTAAPRFAAPEDPTRNHAQDADLFTTRNWFPRPTMVNDAVDVDDDVLPLIM
jgi:hypothetical protein